IMVGLVLVGGDRLAEARQDVTEESEIKLAQKPSPRTRELEYGDLSLRPGRADHLVDAADRVADIAQAEGDADDPERVAGHRKTLGVALDQDHAAGCSMLPDLALAEQEHLTAKVGTDDAREALRGAVVGQGEVRRAGAAIEHRNSGLGRDFPGGEPPPGAVDVQA